MPGMSARPPASTLRRAGSSVSPTLTIEASRTPTGTVTNFAPLPS